MRGAKPTSPKHLGTAREVPSSPLAPHPLNRSPGHTHITCGGGYQATCYFDPFLHLPVGKPFNFLYFSLVPHLFSRDACLIATSRPFPSLEGLSLSVCCLQDIDMHNLHTATSWFLARE